MALTSGETYIFECMGDKEGYCFLNGETGTGFVKLGNNTNPGILSGAEWLATQDARTQNWQFKCKGSSSSGSGDIYLDGRTADGSVYLANVSDPNKSGTWWKVTSTGTGDGNYYIVCQGTGPGDNRYLNGDTVGQGVSVVPPFNPPSGASWRIYQLCHD